MSTENQYAPATTPTSTKMNVLAIVALITGILGFAVIPIILGFISLNQIKKSGESGRGMAIAGIILGFLGVVIWVIVIIATVVAAAAYSSLYAY